MDRNSQVSQGYKLESQIREAYGRVTYTQTCHDKKNEELIKKNNHIKLCQIIFSAITTSGLIVSLFTNERISTIIGAAFSIALLSLNSYTKNFSLIETAQGHQKASDLLWKIREEYVSLLTDFEILEQSKIILMRDELQNRTFEVYSNSPRTDSKSYAKAQKSLKYDEEQTFSDNEIDIMLPNAIRRQNRDIT